MLPTVWIVFENRVDSMYETLYTTIKGIFIDKERAEKCIELLDKENRVLTEVYEKMAELGDITGYKVMDDVSYDMEEHHISDYWLAIEDGMTKNYVEQAPEKVCS